MATTYRYEARTSDGKTVKETIVADSVTEVRQHVQAKGLLLVEVKEASRAHAIQFGGGKLRLAGLAGLIAQLRTYEESGMSAARTFSLLASPERTKDQKLRDMYADIATKIQSGKALSEALADHPQSFPPTLVAQIAAGEESGQMVETLRRIQASLTRRYHIRGEILGAVMYPAVVSVILAVIIAAIFIFLVPQFEEIYSSMGAELPALTQTTFGLSKMLRQWWFVIVPVLGGTPWALRRIYLQNDRFAEQVETFLYRLPLFGRLLRAMVLFGWSENMVSALNAGTPTDRALTLSAASSPSRWLRVASADIAEGVRAGRTLTDGVLRHVNLFGYMVVDLVSAGEAGGQLPQQLNYITSTYQETVEQDVKRLSKALEPVLLAAMGLIVGGIIISVYLPIFGLSEVVQAAALMPVAHLTGPRRWWG